MMVLVFGFVAGPLAAAQTAQADPVNNTTSVNETVQQLRQELQNRSERIDELENRKAELETKVVSQNSRIQKLEFKLEQSRKNTGFSPSEAQKLRSIGAWDPYDDEPALVIAVDRGFGPVVYQYLGPGNGKGKDSFHGQGAWVEIAKIENPDEVRKEGNFTFSLRWAPPGMKTSYTVTSMAEYQTKITKLEDKLNSPEGFIAWSQFNNKKRQDAETFEERVIFLSLGVGAVVVYGAAWVESKNHILNQRRRKRKRSQHTSNLDGKRRSRFWGIVLRIPLIRRVRVWWIKRRRLR